MKAIKFALCLACAVISSVAYAASEKFTGVITVITDDKSAITIDCAGKNVTLSTDPEFVDMAYFEVGDKVEIEGTRQGEAIKAESFRYIFDDTAEEKDDPDMPVDQGSEPKKESAEPAALPVVQAQAVSIPVQASIEPAVQKKEEAPAAAVEPAKDTVPVAAQDVPAAASPAK
jgi:hypothetical protein